jgi:hypothetical protein
MTLTITLAILSCSEEEAKVDIVKVIEEVETVQSIENPSIETITDLEVIKQLKLNLIKERQERNRLHLDSLPISARLIAGDTLVTDSVLSILKKGSYSERSNFIKEITINKPTKFQITNQNIELALIAQINDTEIERQAMKTIGVFNLDYNTAFEKKFNDENNQYTERYFYWLGRKGRSLDAINKVSNLIKKGKLPKKQYDYIIFGLEQFSHSNNKEIRQKAVETLLLAFKNKIITAKDINSLKQEKDRSDKAKSFIKSILRYGDNKSNSIVSICLKNNIYVKEAFQNLVRNKSKTTKPMLLKQLGSKKSIIQSLPAVPIVYKHLKDSVIAIQLLKSVEKQGDYSPVRLELIYNTFKRMGAMSWYRKSSTFLKKKELIDGLKKFKEQPVIAEDYDEMALSIFHFGLTDSLSPNTIEEIKTDGIYIDENSLIKNILSYSGKLLTSEKLAPSTPINYLELFNSFKNHFPSHLSNIEFVSRLENDDYSWLIIGEEIALIAHPKNDDDVYDFNLFLTVLNKIKDSSISFQEMSTDEDVIDIFLGNSTDLKNIKSLLVSKIN